MRPFAACDSLPRRPAYAGADSVSSGATRPAVRQARLTYRGSVVLSAIVTWLRELRDAPWLTYGI